MFAVGGGFKLLSAVAFFFAWKFYKLPVAELSNADSNPDTTSQTTIMDGNTPRDNKDMTELIPVAQFITVSNSNDSDCEKTQPDKEEPRITNV